MGSLKNLITLPGVLIALVVVSTSGCRMLGFRTTLDDHTSELEFEKERALAALRQSIQREGENQNTLQGLEKEIAALQEDLTRQATTVRYLNNEANNYDQEREKFLKELADARSSEQRMRESHEKLKKLATATNEELAELRQQADSTLKTRSKLASDNQRLMEKLDAATKELDDVKEELTRTRAVARTFQEKGPAGGAGNEAELRERIISLERALARAMAKEEEVAEEAPEPAPTAEITPGGDLDLGAVWYSFAAEFKNRYHAAMKGELVWDTFMWTMMGALCILLLSLTWIFFVWRRGRMYRQQIDQLRTHFGAGEYELECAVDAAAEFGTSPQASSASRKQGSSRKIDDLPGRRSTYRSRENSGFSAVISPRTRQAQEEELPPELEEEDSSSPRAPSRRVIGLPGGGEMGSQVGPKSPSSVARKKTAPAEQPGPDEFSEDDMTSTQIISNLDSTEIQSAPDLTAPDLLVPDPSAPGKKKESSSSQSSEGDGDQDLLDDLKEIINKKFDELLK